MRCLSLPVSYQEDLEDTRDQLGRGQPRVRGH